MKQKEDIKQLWEDDIKAAKLLNRKPETLSGIPIKLLYTPENLKDMDFEEQTGYPGFYPYTRGVYTTMYRGRLFTIRQFSGFSTAEETNRRYKYLLKQGQTGLSVAFDLPTLMGRDTDDPLSSGEVGKCGVAIDTLADMEILFDGIKLEDVSTSMTINGPAAHIWAMYIAVAERQGGHRKNLRGTLQNDILKEYIAQKEYIFPPKPSMKLVTDTVEFQAKEMPLWNSISISGYHIREAGSTAVQELAFTLADGFAYVEDALSRGLDIDEFAPRLSFFFNSHIDFFEELCKMRAARRIWARYMKEKYKAKDPRSWLLRFHTQTAGCSLTAQQPENNIIRTAFEALAGVLGGTQSLHTNSMDETWALPSEKAVTIAVRTQQIIQDELEVTHTIDPLAGSYYVESLTNEMEKQAEAYFRKINDLGGVLKAIDKGFIQQEIADAAFDYQRKLEKGEKIIVGVNKYVQEDEKIEIPILKISDEIHEFQLARLNKVKAGRDNDKVRDTLAALKKACSEDQNVMPYLVACSHAYCSLGEMVNVMRRVFGEYHEPPVF